MAALLPIFVAAGSISGRYRSEPTFSLRELLCCVSNACQRQSPFLFSFSSFFSSNRIQDHEGLFAWPVIQLEGCHHVYGFALDACQQRQGGGKS